MHPLVTLVSTVVVNFAAMTFEHSFSCFAVGCWWIVVVLSSLLYSLLLLCVVGCPQHDSEVEGSCWTARLGWDLESQRGPLAQDGRLSKSVVKDFGSSHDGSRARVVRLQTTPEITNLTADQSDHLSPLTGFTCTQRLSGTSCT